MAEAFRHPPESSSQILHPELYLADPRENPVEIDFSDQEVAGQKPIEDNVLGEFGARQLFFQWLHDQPRAEEAANGWRGDRYLVYQHDNGTSYVWKTVCRDRPAAERFFEAVRQCNAVRYRMVETRVKKSFPVRRADGQTTEGKAVLRTAEHPPGRVIEMYLTPANEVVVIDAQESFSAVLGARFAAGVDFSGL